MKNITLLFLLLSVMGFAQIPPGYYNSANGLTGYQLKSELNDIISTGYNGQSYEALITLYNTSDNDEYYDNGTQTNTILDMYSENPNGPDPYNWVIGVNANCGNFNSEADCYNREHIFPQGFFSQNEPMRSDAHHVIPTDGWVNGGRSNLPFGEVNPNGASITTYMNGSKKGPSITTGFSGQVFEPLDEFKGDIARMLLYFATRYENNINDSGWDAANASSNNPRDGSSDRFYEQWYIDLLLDWHNQDPVSQKEIDRNNDIYAHQNNRNPYVDNPQYVNMIWTTTNNPSGRLFATLKDTFIDVDMDNFASVGDQITYEYEINNIGTTNLFNVRAVPDFGTFNSPGQIAQLNAGINNTDAFGTLTYTLTANDVASACSCVINKLTVTANFNAAGTNGSLIKESDDPDNFANVDGNGDMLPDDDTRTNLNVQMPSGAATELFISEYIEGGGNNKALEIANYTGSSVNLADYSIQLSQNGSGTWNVTETLSGTLQDQEVYVLARGNANAAILAEADLLLGSSSVLNFNGNDAIGLFKAGILLDVVGDPNSNVDDIQNETLVRKSNVTGPKTTFDKAGEWNVFAQDNSSDLGIHTFDNTASNDDFAFQNISIYPNPSSGTFYIGNLENEIEQLDIYDLSGRQLEIALNNNYFYINRTGVFIARLKINRVSKTYKLIVK
ncbi:MAG: endonuclease [Nonlabens sp.]|uniref:endonuclease n=1 Tax=Nonlabens sp. TaxID=1888209 RepID=UPI00321BAD47